MDIRRMRFERQLDAFLQQDDKRRAMLQLDPGRVFRPFFLTCRIKMLVVLDGGGFGASDFGLEEFLDAFTTAPAPGVAFDITKAHYGSDADADIEGFTFDDYRDSLDEYDVIWLFGVLRGSGSISDDDLEALALFMDGGGGVFATGDHEDLGVVMCGKVPRVRSMRMWHWPDPGPNGEPVAPPVGGTDRHDTTWDRGVGSIVFNDQSDDVPQTIRPKMYSTPHPFLFGRTYRYPHPVLCGTDGVIDILPDHAHEGDCYVPSDLTMSFTFNGTTIEEYPTDANGQRIRPEVIAWSDNQAGIQEKGALDPKTFGAIGVLDGHEADVGRVLVDATWHHFFNINLRGYQFASDPIQQVGFYGSPAGMVALERIKNYYRNIGVWLARESTHRCIAWRMIWHTRWHNRIAMDLRFVETSLKKIEPAEFIRIGRAARDVMGQFASQCQSLGWIRILFPFDIQRALLYSVIPGGPLLPGIRPEEVAKMKSDPVSETMAQAILDATLGAMIYQTAQQFPDEKDFNKAAEVEDVRELFKDAVEIGLKAGADAGHEAMENAKPFMDRMEALR